MGLNIEPDEKLSTTVPTQLRVNPKGAEPVTLGKQMGAAFQLDNFAFNAGQAVMEAEHFPRQEGFDLGANLTLDELQNPEPFHSIQSQPELDSKRRRIKREQQARQYLDKGPMPAFLASLIAIGADPTNYAPILGSYKAGGTVLRAGARAAGKAAAENVAIELGLMALQEERKLSEALMAGVMGGAIGFGVGTFASRLGSREANKAVNEAVDYVEKEMGGGSVGAARPGDLGKAPPEDTKLVGHNKPLQALVHKLGKIGFASPALEMGLSRFAAVRSYVHTAFDTGLMTRGEKAGRRTGNAALETQFRGQKDALNNGLFGAVVEARMASKAAGVEISQHEIARELAKALRRGDTHPTNPAITDLARKVRKDLLDPFKDELVAGGFFKKVDKVTGATSYFPRVLDLNKLKGEAGERFKNDVADWMEGRWEGELPADHKELFRQQAADLIRQQMDNPMSRIPTFSVGARGSAKGKTWDIPDEMIEDYLDNDAMRVLGRYINTMTVDSGLRIHGFENLAEPEKLLKDLADEVDFAKSEIAKHPDANTRDKKLRKLDDERLRAEALMRGTWNRLRGLDALKEGGGGNAFAKNAGAGLRTFNFIKSLGSVLISSSPDPFRIVMTEGVARAFGVPLKDMMTGFKGMRGAKRNLQHNGNALDLISNQRAAYLLDAIDAYSADVAFTRGLSKTSNLFSKMTGLPYWNVAWKSATAFVVENRIADVSRLVAAGKKVGARDMTRMAQSRLGEQDMRIIAAQVEKHGEEINGSWHLNQDKWDDTPEVNPTKQALADAINRDVDNTIITPGTADAPLWTGTEWGKTIFQFKRFGAAATSRVMIAGLQSGLGQKDMSVAVGMALMAATGAASVALKDLVRTGEVKDRSAGEWAKEGVDRSGLMGVYFDLEGIIGAGTGGYVPSSIISGAEPSRYAGRHFLARVGGPTAGTGVQVQEFGANLAKHTFGSGTPTAADLTRAEKLLPFVGLFYFQYLTRKLDLHNRAVETLGLPERSK